MNERNNSPTTNLHQRSASQDETSTPQRSAEVIQNRNATDGNYTRSYILFYNFTLFYLFFVAQRVRRTSRSREEESSQRRQRQRQMRPVINIGGSVRPPNITRPAIDLPPGYGEKLLLFNFHLNFI
jgi:hypothetical protein